MIYEEPRFLPGGDRYMLIEFGNEAEENYYICMSRAIGAFARGLAPIMAVELARRSLEAGLVPNADDLENILKSATSN